MLFHLFFIFSFFKIFFKKSTQIIRPQKGNPEGSFEDTLLNFGLMYSKLITEYLNKTQFRKPGGSLMGSYSVVDTVVTVYINTMKTTFLFKF